MVSSVFNLMSVTYRGNSYRASVAKLVSNAVDILIVSKWPNSYVL